MYQLEQIVHYCCLVTKLYMTLCDPKNCSTPVFPVLHYLSEFAQTHAQWVCDDIQPAHPLLSPSPPASHLSRHQGLFQWVNSLNHINLGVAVKYLVDVVKQPIIGWPWQSGWASPDQLKVHNKNTEVSLRKKNVKRKKVLVLAYEFPACWPTLQIVDLSDLKIT